MADALKVYTSEEVKKHTSADDLWIVVWNHVYDLTSYQEDHPGGKEYLRENAGADATRVYEDIGHSTDAREILEKFLIGQLPEDEWTNYSDDDKLPEVVPQQVHIANNQAQTPVHNLWVPSIGAGLALATLSLTFGKRYSEQLHFLQTGRFWYGFGMASTISLSMAAAAAYWASRHFNISAKAFTSYPAHIKSVPRNKVASKKSINLGVLNPREYKTFPLVDKVKLSNDAYRFVFGLPKEDAIVGLPTGQHIAIRTVIDGKQVTRSYTPSSSNKDLGRLELTVKIYSDGVITQYLDKLQIGDKVEIRGPKGVMKYHKNLVKEIGMVAGGTGITPMYSMIRRICEDPRDDTKISLIYANKTEQDILLRKELDNFAKTCPQNLEVYYILSDPPAGWNQGVGRATKADIEKRLPAPRGDDTKALVCGPPGLEKAVVGYLEELGFKSPSPVSRSTDQIFLFQ